MDGIYRKCYAVMIFMVLCVYDVVFIYRIMCITATLKITLNVFYSIIRTTDVKTALRLGTNVEHWN